MADTPLFVNAEQLHGMLDDTDVQVVAVESINDFTRAHIPGALQLAMHDFTASQPPVAGLMPSADTLATVFSNAGLRDHVHIVAYDRVGDGPAARLLYTLDAMGHSAVALLDGGLAAWQAAGFDLERGPPAPGTGSFSVDRQPHVIADRDWIESHLTDAGACFLDVRSAAEYAGLDVRSAHGGHIPGAVHLDWTRLKDGRGRLRPRAELLELLRQQGISRDADITTYCQSHVRSSYAYLVLKSLGYTRVRGYPGAWSDWGNADDTPIESGSDDPIG